MAGWPEKDVVIMSCAKAEVIYATPHGEGSSSHQPVTELVASSSFLQPHLATCLWPVALHGSFHLQKSNN